MTAQTAILKKGQGAWDVTSFPFGGDFIRPSEDVELINVRESAKEGWALGECFYGTRKGTRTICFKKETPRCRPDMELGIHGRYVLKR